MSRHLDDSTQASDPGQVRLSETKLRRLCPRLFGWRGLFREARTWRERLAEHLQQGDSRAAVVVQTEPQLLVAAYTDELDCVALLVFPHALVPEYRLTVGARLLTVNTYGDDPALAADLRPGPRASDRWTNFYPLIADFLSDDGLRIGARKQAIPEAEWRRAADCALAYLREHGARARQGDPRRSWEPAL